MIIFSLNIKTPTTTSFNNENQIKELKVLTLITHDPIEILNDGNFSDYGFDGFGNETHPYVIEEYNITTLDEKGIYIYNTSKYFVIQNCYLDADNTGIYIYDIANGTATIKNNTCTNNNNDYGIYLYRSSNSTLTNNTCTNNNDDGIHLDSSSDCILTNNTCTNNNVGIHLDSSSDCILTNNTCANSFSGIYLISSSDCILTNNTCTINSFGISLHSSSGSSLTNNTCINNSEGIRLGTGSSSSDLINNTCINNYRGIFLHSSGSSLITYNLLQENDEYGIYIDSNSNNNEIHHNIFVDNNLGGTSQAYDEGENNIWYDSTINEGNYWSDYTGFGSYSIDGSAGSVDPYPLDEEGNPLVSEFLQISTITMTLFLCLALIPLLLNRRRKIN